MPVLRSALIALSHNRPLRRLMEQTHPGRKLSSRFVAGMEITDALNAAEQVQRHGIGSTLDALGESVNTEAEARQAADSYHQLLDMVSNRKLNANVSLKLTQMGLGLSVELAEEILTGLVQHAASIGNFVRVDMEESALTQTTLDMVRRVHARPGLKGAVGIVIQAYLYRSAADIEQLLADGIRVRLCKGAYKEPASVAFPNKLDVDANYVQLSHTLMASPIYHGLATHDVAMIEAAKHYASKRGIKPERFEFQMLYGVRRDLQRQLVQDGYNVRIYIPFGKEWYPYFMRRLAERPANVLFLAKNFFR
ncbi:proline dehydrogenase family protein [Telmatobacter bradus]|uniref:proline dehydrogenase family protein n=1 Tax=Telmatobacter bradus TaxID=474953 RepID=UPI003B43530C